MASPPSAAPGAEQLVSFVPRLTIEWLRDDPGRTWVEVDGTLAFVDISGFTAMSEKLSNKGRRGVARHPQRSLKLLDLLADQGVRVRELFRARRR